MWRGRERPPSPRAQARHFLWSRGPMASHIQATAAVTGRRGGRLREPGREARSPAPPPVAALREHARPGALEGPPCPLHPSHTERGPSVPLLHADRLSQAGLPESRAHCARLSSKGFSRSYSQDVFKRASPRQSSAASFGFWGDDPEQAPARNWISLCQKKLRGPSNSTPWHHRPRQPSSRAGSCTPPHGGQALHSEAITH